MSNEKKIEKKLRLGVERLGGLCLKMPATFFAGIPDRLCLLPGALAFFVETKGEGLKLRPRQVYVAKQLEALGFKVYVANNEALVEDLLKAAAAVYEAPKPAGLTPEEKEELANLTKARGEIKWLDPTDDLNDEELARYTALRKKALNN